MIRAEALARGRLFTRSLIVLAVVLATCALVADAMAAGIVEPMLVPAAGGQDGLYLPTVPFQQPVPLDGWEVAIGTADLFAVIDPDGWPFRTEEPSGSATTTETDLAFGIFCFLIAGLLLWAARCRRPLGRRM